MNFRYLEYLVAIARLSHFGKAVEECHVSQSALSIQLKKLEGEIGVQLLERTSSSVVVTETGWEVVGRARELLQGRQELLDAARHFSGGFPERLKIGAIPTIAPYLFGELQTEFQKQFPGTTLVFDEEVTELLIPSVANGELEAGILATPLEDTLLDEMVLFEEPFLLAVPTRHPLAKQRQISPKDLESDLLLMLKDTHCLREQVMGFCSAYKVSGNRQSAAASVATLLALVRSNGGITLLPKMATGKRNHLSGIRSVPIFPAPTRRLRVIYRKTSKVGRRLAEAILKCVCHTEGEKTMVPHPTD